MTKLEWVPRQYCSYYFLVSLYICIYIFFLAVACSRSHIYTCHTFRVPEPRVFVVGHKCKAEIFGLFLASQLPSIEMHSAMEEQPKHIRTLHDINLKPRIRISIKLVTSSQHLKPVHTLAMQCGGVSLCVCVEAIRERERTKNYYEKNQWMNSKKVWIKNEIRCGNSASKRNP